MTNIFAFRATDPKVMKARIEPIGIDNNQWLVESAAEAGLILAAWGNHGKHLDRYKTVKSLIAGMKCFRVTKEGQPEHPLYQAKNAQLISFI